MRLYKTGLDIRVLVLLELTRLFNIYLRSGTGPGDIEKEKGKQVEGLQMEVSASSRSMGIS